MKTLMAIVLLVGVIVAVGAWQFSEDAAPDAAVTPASTTAADAASPATLASASAPPAAPMPTASASTDVARLIEAANGADAKQRVDAIEALSRAPREQALPALHRIVTNGDPQVDKPAALNSLRELALGQGDQDGKVREAIREVLYHDDGQNPQLIVAAQEALDVVEESEMK